MPKKILVTGAAGFIGSWVARRLVDEKNMVVTIDNLSTGYAENIPEGVEFIHGNCQDESIIPLLNKYKFDAIFHIAGQSSGEISFDDPVYDLQTNTQSTILLLKYALDTGCKNFTYASTMSVYGDNSKENTSEEIMPLPKSFYAVGKLASENYMRIYSSYGIQCTALRLFNVYGPGQNMKNLRQGMVSIYLAQAIKNRIILVKGSKDRFRDLVYIDDVASAFVKALDEPRSKKMFDFYNISTSIKCRVEDIINMIKSNLKYEIEVVHEGSTAGDIFGITGDSRKFQNEYFWKPLTKPELGIKNMVESCRIGDNN